MLPLFQADLRQTILTDEVLMKIYQHAIKEHPKNFPVNISLGDLAITIESTMGVRTSAFLVGFSYRGGHFEFLYHKTSGVVSLTQGSIKTVMVPTQQFVAEREFK